MSANGHLKFQGTNRATFVGETSNIMFDTTTTSLGIGVTGTDHPSSNLYITGNAYISNSISVGGVLTMGTVNVVARHDLEAVTAMGNTTPLTVEFTNATTGIVTTGNVEVGNELTVTGNATVSSNLTVSGNVEVSADTQVQEYPPRSLHQYITHVEGHGVFSVVASAELNQTGDNDRAWKLFTKIADADNYWTPANGGYDVSTGNATSASPSTDGTTGHWVQLELPYKIKLHSVKIAAGLSNRQAKDATVFGSNDGGSTWTNVGGWTGNNVSDFSLVTFSMNNVGYYNLYRLVVTKNGGNAALTLTELQLLGTSAHTTLDKDSLSLSRSLDVPRLSRYDVDTETPRPEKLLVDLDTTVNSSPIDMSGKGNHGTFGGSAYYSSADKAFILANNPAAVSSASTHYIRAELNNSETGNQYHSVSLWVKVLSGQNSGWRAIFECGENPRSGNSDIGLYVPGGDDKLVFAHGGSNMYTDTLTNLYFQWHHVVLTYDGANRKLYLDGTLIKTQATTTWAGVANMTLHFGKNNATGGNEGCDCHVSNFKLYWQTALEASEVQKLYRLGRTGRSMIITDTAVGIGKAPEAQLDVRGVVNVEGLLQINGFNAKRVLIGYQRFSDNTAVVYANSIAAEAYQDAWSINYERKRAGSQIYIIADLCTAQAIGATSGTNYRDIDARLKVWDGSTNRFSDVTRDWTRIDSSFFEYQRHTRIHFGPEPLPGGNTITVVAQVAQSAGSGTHTAWGINIWGGRSFIEVFETMEA